MYLVELPARARPPVRPLRWDVTPVVFHYDHQPASYLRSHAVEGGGRLIRRFLRTINRGRKAASTQPVNSSAQSSSNPCCQFTCQAPLMFSPKTHADLA